MALQLDTLALNTSPGVTLDVKSLKMLSRGDYRRWLMMLVACAVDFQLIARVESNLFRSLLLVLIMEVRSSTRYILATNP